MYFKRIELHGFKSFADPVSIEFNDGITCVVGPNGSGKSNISDAIRWVLGEQSPKTLRGGKMEEVIFSGTASRKSRGMAEVTLVIDNTSEILPIAYNEVAITRRMYRSGESEYSINKNPCRLRDIRELIMDTGIGVDGYSLIGQGRIADIVGNKPESRREIFEEAAGIVLYRSKKAETEKKLEASASNLDRVNDIIVEFESRIDGLREDSEKATEYLALRERYKALEVNITLKQIENLELKNEYLIDDIAETQHELDEKKEEKAGIDQALSASREKAEVLEKLSEETRDKLMSSAAEISALTNQSELSVEKLASIEKEESRLKEEIDGLAGKLEKEGESLRELARAGREIGERLRGLEDALREKVEIHTRVTAELTAKGLELDQRKDDIFTSRNAINAKNSEAGSLDSLKSALERRRLQILSEKRESAGAESETRAGLENSKRGRDEIKGSLASLDEERRKLSARAEASVREEKKLAGEVEELRVLIGQLSSRKKTIEEMESNYEGYNGAVKFIMKAGLAGIHGVVAELIKVPAGYEVAIETALGAGLSNIVCADDAAARAAVSLLKENRAGRLTFLPVGSIRGGGSRGRGESGLKGAPGFKGYAVDCVAFDAKYSEIMEYLLGRVVVVGNLADAIKLSKTVDRGFRFVTLEGEIINAAGAITGGAYKNRTANLLERKSEIERLRLRIEEKKEAIARAAERLETLRTSIESAAAVAAETDAARRAAELELVKRESEIEAANHAIQDFDSDKAKWDAELRAIEEEQKSADGMIQKLRDEIEALAEGVESAEKAAEAALAGHDERKAEAEKISEDITNARIAASACESEKSNTDLLAGRVQAAIDEMMRECQKREKQREEIAAERETILSGSAGSVGDLKKKEEEKAAIESYLKELTEERAEVAAALAEAARDKEALDEKTDALQSQRYELEIKKTKNETQLDNYKEKLWEEFEISYVQAIEYRKKDFAMGEAVKESREIRGKIKELGEVNVGAIKEYETVSERYSFLTGQRADILEAMSALKRIVDDLDKTIIARFEESFDRVVENFGQIFKELFGGGIAQLRLEDESKPLDSGIEIIAQPPGKKLQNINLMSGGEKSLTAIALMFAVLKAKPTPFCILDEVEAALDDANIARFASYLRKFKEIQFALVTHQKATMEYADVLYGVTMPEQGISKIISLRMGDTFEF